MLRTALVLGTPLSTHRILMGPGLGGGPRGSGGGEPPEGARHHFHGEVLLQRAGRELHDGRRGEGDTHATAKSTQKEKWKCRACTYLRTLLQDL